MTPIRCGDYRKMVEYVFDADGIDSPPPSGLVFCPLDRIYQFFKLIKTSGTFNRYVVISTRSDFGLCYQNEHPFWRDMIKWMPFVSSDPAIKKLGYRNLNIEPRGRVEQCKADDKFCVKCYSWTLCTFDDIPKNIIRWYCTNSNVREFGIIPVPFGIQEEADTSIFEELRNNQKLPAIYVNFETNTNERLELKRFMQHLAQDAPIEVVEEPKPYESYLCDLSQFEFVLCPPGNGFDSYRFWETLYCGSTAVIVADHWNNQFSNMNVVSVNYKELFSSNLYDILKSRKPAQYNEEMLSMEFWAASFDEAAKSFGPALRTYEAA